MFKKKFFDEAVNESVVSLVARGLGWKMDYKEIFGGDRNVHYLELIIILKTYHL